VIDAPSADLLANNNIDQADLPRVMAFAAQGAVDEGFNLDNYAMMASVMFLNGGFIRAWGGWSKQNFAYNNGLPQGAPNRIDINVSANHQVNLIAIQETANWGRCAHEFGHNVVSAPSFQATDKYYQFAKLVEELSSATDYVIDEKLKTANLTEHGIRKVEKRLGVENLYEKDFAAIHHIQQALRAKTLFAKDRDYVVKDGEIIIVDEFTGRLMPGRRWSEGLHQAIEAKEGVKIEQESQTLATISFQNYFRLYEKLAGMTGTAATEAEEFHKIYKLEVIVVPTHKPMIRDNMPDVVYKTAKAKFTAVAVDVQVRHQKGQPVLIGTTSIEKNEFLSSLLKRKGIPHQVLNAKNHQREAEIISQAGQKNAVTFYSQ